MEYWATVVALAGINTILALSVYSSFMVGIVSLGQIAFFAVGAFTSATLTVLLGWHLLPALAVGALLAALLGAIIAMPLLRLKGFILTITTVAFVEVTRVVFHNMEYGRRVPIGDGEGYTWLGPEGPLGFRHIDWFGRHNVSVVEYAVWIVLAVIVVGIYFFVLERSRLGYAMRAIEADEVAARGIGIKHHFTKVLAFTIGGGIAGIAGGLLAHHLTFITGNDFGIQATVIALAYAVIGGGQTFVGPIVGAVVFTFLPEVLRFTQEYRLEIFGALMLLTMLFRPQGMISAAMVQSAGRGVRSLIARAVNGGKPAGEVKEKEQP